MVSVLLIEMLLVLYRVIELVLGVLLLGVLMLCVGNVVGLLLGL